MARNRYYVAEGTPAENDPQAAAFAKILNKLLLERGWRQMDLVRKAQPFVPEGVKFERYLVSAWARGRHLPSPVSLDILCKVFNIPMSELMPKNAAVVVGAKKQDLQMFFTKDGHARVCIDVEVPTETAIKVMSLINDALKN